MNTCQHSWWWYFSPSSQIFCRRSGSWILQTVSVSMSKRFGNGPYVHRTCCSQVRLDLVPVRQMSFLIASSPPTFSKIGLGGDLVQRLSCIFWRNRSPAPLVRPTLKLGTCRTACDSSISRRWCSCSHVVWVTLGSVSLMESGAPDGYGPPYCQYAYG